MRELGMVFVLRSFAVRRGDKRFTVTASERWRRLRHTWRQSRRSAKCELRLDLTSRHVKRPFPEGRRVSLAREAGHLYRHEITVKLRSQHIQGTASLFERRDE